MFAWGGAALFAALGAGTLPARADEQADALLKEVATATKAAKTLSADLTLSQEVKGQPMKMEGKVKLKKPNLARIELGPPANQTVVSDGKTLWMYMKSDNQYLKRNADVNGLNMFAPGAFPVSMFFNPEFTGLANNLADYKMRVADKETIGGKECQVIEATAEKPISHTIKLYVSPAKLVTRSTIDLKQGQDTIKLTADLSNVQVDQPLTTAAFTFTPPKTAKLYQPPKQEDMEASLVAVGKEAPKFSLPTPTGGHVALTDALKDKKAVLVNFWFYG